MRNVRCLLEYLTKHWPPINGQAHGIILKDGELQIALRTPDGKGHMMFVFSEEHYGTAPEELGRVTVEIAARSWPGVQREQKDKREKLS